MRDGTAVRRRPRRGPGRRGMGLRGPLPRPGAVGHRLPAAARRGRAGRPGQRDVHRRLHRPGRVQRRRGRRCARGSSPSPTGGCVDDWRRRSRRPQVADDPGDLDRAARRGRRGRRPGRRRRRRPCTGCAPSCPTTSGRCCCCASWPTSRWSRSPRRWAGRWASVKALQRRGLRTLRAELEDVRPKKSVPARTPTSPSGDDRGEMTTAADDAADEDAFEAFLAGRPVPARRTAGLAAFAGAVRATATQPGGPAPPSPNCWPPVFSPTSRARPPRRLVRPTAGDGDPACSPLPSSPSSRPLVWPPRPPAWPGVAVVGLTTAGFTGSLPDGAQHTFATVVDSVTPLTAPDPEARPADPTPVDTSGTTTGTTTGTDCLRHRRHRRRQPGRRRRQRHRTCAPLELRRNGEQRREERRRRRSAGQPGGARQEPGAEARHGRHLPLTLGACGAGRRLRKPRRFRGDDRRLFARLVQQGQVRPTTAAVGSRSGERGPARD